MIINEDFFNNLEVKDEDIVTDDYTDTDSGTITDVKTFFETMFSKYKSFMSIRTRIKLNNEQDKVWNELIPTTYRHITALLDAFDIEHSEPVLFNDNIRHIYRNDYSKYVIEDLHGFKIINGTEQDKRSDHIVDIILYLNIPQFTYKRVYRFITTLANCIWKTEISSKAFPSIYLIYEAYESMSDYYYPSDSSKCLRLHNDYLYMYYKINSKYKGIWYDILRFFFQESNLKKLYLIWTKMLNTIKCRDS